MTGAAWRGILPEPNPAGGSAPLVPGFTTVPTLRTAFPDLRWLKQAIATGQGWPSVILNVCPAEVVERPDIAGPLSLFLNLRGESFCTLEGRRRRVTDDVFFLTNAGDHYSLEIAAPTAAVPLTETFNIHFGTGLAETLLRDLTTPAARLLDDPFGAGTPVVLWPKLYPQDYALRALVGRIRQAARTFNHHPLLRDQLLGAVLAYLLGRHRQAWRAQEALPAAKAATRQELGRRVGLAIDYLHAHFEADIDLDTLARVACLSKFHFLRAFRVVTGEPPFAYARRLRLRQARRLLGQTSLPVGAVALHVGFESDSAFHRAFREETGMGPLAWRQAHE